MKIVVWLTILSSFTQMKTFGQSGIILNIPVNDTLLLKGNVNVLHGPDHYYKDSTFVEYIHYIMIYTQDNTVKYHEIFDSPHRDSLVFDSYTFQVINDTMYFFTENEFLNFTGLGKTLFLSYPRNVSEKTVSGTPRVLKADTLNKWGIDTNYFDYLKFSWENSIEEEEFIFKKGEIADSVIITLFKSSDEFDYVSGVGSVKTGVYSNLKKIIGVRDSSGYYVNIEYHETRKSSKRNSSYTQISTVYNRMENIPHKILNSLE